MRNTLRAKVLIFAALALVGCGSGGSGNDVGAGAAGGGGNGGSGGVGGSSGPPPANACATTTRCSRASGVTPCPSGYDCNDQLSPPVCTMLYCTTEGSSCAADAQCVQGLSCIGSVCRTSCGYPPCLATLFSECPMTGPCTVQFTGGSSEPLDQVECFQNGVSEAIQWTTDQSGNTVVTATVKKNGSVCYTFSGEEGPYGQITQTTVEDPSGTAVATMSSSPGDDGTTYTCSGEAPWFVDSIACGAGTAAACTEGTCTP